MFYVISILYKKKVKVQCIFAKQLLYLIANVLIYVTFENFKSNLQKNILTKHSFFGRICHNITTKMEGGKN